MAPNSIKSPNATPITSPFGPPKETPAHPSEIQRCEDPDVVAARESSEGKKATTPHDHLVKQTRRSKARAKLARLAKPRSHEKTPAWMRGNDLQDSYRSKKMEKGAKHSPSQALENDPRVLAYRWDPKKQEYQVTKVDTKRTHFEENGIVIRGVTVELNGKKQSLRRALATLRGHTRASIKAFKAIQKTPFGNGSAKTAIGGALVQARLQQVLQAIEICQHYLDKGKVSEAKTFFTKAVKIYRDAQVAAKKTAADFRSHTKTTIDALRVVKAAGRVAETALMVIGAGAAAKMASGALERAGASLLKQAAGGVVAGASVKTAYQAASEIRDQGRHPVDWKRVAKHAGENMLWNMLSDGLTSGLTHGLTKTYDVKSVDKLSKGVRVSAHVIGEVTTLLLRITKAAYLHAVHSGEHKSPAHIAHDVVSEASGTLKKLFGKEHGEHIEKEIETIVITTLVHILH